jgi:Ca2+-binding EF-hand superfamily protein
LEESVLVVNGFNALDSNSDGLLSRTDFEMFFKKRKGKPPADEIDRIMWLLDDNR